VLNAGRDLDVVASLVWQLQVAAASVTKPLVGGRGGGQRMPEEALHLR
jgi:hypothetical protein